MSRCQGDVVRAAMCKAYADGTRDTLASVAEALAADPRPDVREAGAALRAEAPALMATLRRLFAERAGVEL